VLDFAYEIHTEIGNKAIGAKVNHKLVPLNHKLASGDQVEIITSDKNRVQREWLDIVITAKAKTAIKNTLKADIRNRIEKGQMILESKLQELDLKPSSRIFQKILPAYGVSNKEELYSKIGSDLITLDDLPKILRKNAKNKWVRYWGITLGLSKDDRSSDNEDNQDTVDKYTKKSPFILKENPDEKTVSYTIASCCNPIPGDDVIGYRNVFNSIVIHKSKCSTAVKLLSSQSERIVPTRWTTHKLFSFLTKIAISGIDRFGIFNQITTVITKELNINIRTIHLSAHDGIFEGEIEIYVHNINDVNRLITNLTKIKGVVKANRVENFEE
ncbi:MAG TPA: TGS domain-containing protein, partial [Bacteroidales bacterium]|nr:TGS domain-containing protein [Bacteroidales bacterium]